MYFRANSANVCGTTYKKGHVVVCDITDEDPKLGLIVDIYETPGAKTLFITHRLITVCFNQHFYAYEVVSTSTFDVFQYYQFKDHHPLHICRSFCTGSSQYVVMKYHIIKK